MGAHGAALVPPGARILTHCNAGALATAGYGTALGVVRAAHAQGKVALRVGGRDAAGDAGLAAHRVGAGARGHPAPAHRRRGAASVMARGEVDLVVTGADRIAANGDTANKIGTYGVAVLARHHGIPFYVAAPFSTIDPASPSGPHIPIEERDAREVRRVAGAGDRAGGLARLQPRLRRHAGRADHRDRDRARRLPAALPLLGESLSALPTVPRA